MTARPIPEATVARLPVYLRVLVDLAGEGVETVSSEELAELAGVNAAKVRKDLSHLGSYGTRGVGYDVSRLRLRMSRALGLVHTWPVVIAGFGNIGRALAKHEGFRERGFPVVAAFDVDPELVGTSVEGVPVHHPDDLAAVVAETGAAIGVIATPAAAAQQAADRLVDAGVRALLNFAPAVLTVPPQVSLRAVDLVVELQILGFHLSQTSAGGRRRRRSAS